MLSSMHKYQPRLIITPQSNSSESEIFSFPETQFIAVTAYQNTNVSIPFPSQVQNIKYAILQM